MYSIGILTKEPIWGEKLSGFVNSIDFRIAGSFYEDNSVAMVVSEVFLDSDLIWIPTMEAGVLECAIQAVKLSRHVLFGFPVSRFPDEACELVELANEARVQVQVGHHEHYNPAFRSMKKEVHQPQYIDLQHHIGFSQGDYSHTLFHALLTDIEMCISLVPDSLKKFQSHAAYICDGSPPILNVRMEFNNGAAASLRIDPFNTGNGIKMAVFQRQSIFSADLQGGTVRVETFPKPGCTDQTTISTIWPSEGFPVVSLGENDPEFITLECLSFIQSITNNILCVSSLEQGCEALKIARNIFDRISITVD